MAALGLLFVGTAVAQDQPTPGDQFLPYPTQEECEANGGLWAFDSCVDPEKIPVQTDGDSATQAPAAPSPAAPAQAGPATPSQPQYTG